MTDNAARSGGREAQAGQSDIELTAVEQQHLHTLFRALRDVPGALAAEYEAAENQNYGCRICAAALKYRDYDRTEP